ncbi:uncharacterized protein LOC133850721 isoform X1 [Drosophila sulfurigaster albostrigata]|uniref:uncharacterized protein LOC133850721 isoform X1 n=1 Tax=Drosophila sulfurigaster albostrigata TaxID=89887 RepID=UPI002D21B540|nr:uncharacterized protein LOC133850721 isoform X1 [Drosophila sulfurigaster albostrigata]
MRFYFFVIKHVKAAPFVWDHAHPQFTFKSRKAKFWSLLAEKVNTYGGLFATTPVTKEALQKKWTNMKTYYLFEESKSRRIGAEADSFSTTWKFRSTLSFLSSSLGTAARPQALGQAEGSSASATNPSEGSCDFSEDDPLATQEGIPANITIKTEEPCLDELSTEDPSILQEDDNDNDNVEEEHTLPSPPVRKRAKDASMVEGQSSSRYTHRANYYHYGMTVAQDLDQLDEDFKIDAKLEIMQIIAKYKREQYLNQTES